MRPIPMCGIHGVALMLRQSDEKVAGVLACPYCDMEELGGGEAERSIIDDALYRKAKPN